MSASTVDPESIVRAASGPNLNPVTRLAAGLLIALIIVWTIDPVSAGTALALELALFPLLAIGWSRFWRRTAVVWVAAPLSGLTLVLYGQSSGRVYLDWGIIEISDGSITLGIANLLRVLAIALPTVVLLIGVDPTDLADGLIQLVRLPSRFVLGGLAALRLAGLLREDFRMLELARRARGVADRGRLRRFFGLAFAVLVLSIRRGSALATAMEARGFGGHAPRSRARTSRLSGADGILVAVAVLVGVIAVAVSVATGWWHPVIG